MPHLPPPEVEVDGLRDELADAEDAEDAEDWAEACLRGYGEEWDD